MTDNKNITTKIEVEDWVQESEGNWVVSIKTNFTAEDDLKISFIDSEEYIKEHKYVYDYIIDGYTLDGLCIIRANNRPNCPIKILLELLDKDEDENKDDIRNESNK